MPASVSVLIPSYNHSAFLRETLDSVLSQTFSDIEVLVLDDGSKDGSVAIAEAFAQRDRRLRVWQQDNAGTVATLNRLYAQSTGPFVCQLGSDDVWEPTFLEHSLKDLEDHPEALATFCRFHTIDKDSNIVFTAPFPFGPELSADGLLEYLMPHNCLGALTACIRREALQRTLPFARPLRGVEDWDLWLRLCKLGPLRVREFVGARYRVHGANQSLQMTQHVAENHLQVLQDHTSEIFAKYRLTSASLSKVLSHRIALLFALGKTRQGAVWLEKKYEKFGLDTGESMLLAEALIGLGRAKEAAEHLRQVRTR